ncbi:hypothetical protein L1049_003211 [Liquidambar formosana]|uniref:Uncharacterized protein n=1 Tax=Liquidambar formosana TaxID=63359 RepID=A0AAP0R9E7_LIQFO
MGSATSKPEKNEALRLCKERRRLIKQAIDSRNALAAAHVAYIQCLRNIGIALRRYAEAEVLIESSLSTSATDLDKTPSHSSYPSPSPSHLAEVSDSPLNNESPLSPPIPTLSYMRAGGSAAVTVRFSPSSTSYLDDESMAFPMPPPPPPPDSGSWDFFDPTDDSECLRNMGHNGLDENFYDMRAWRQFKVEGANPKFEAKGKWAKVGLDGNNELNEELVRSELEHKTPGISSNSANRNNCYGRFVGPNAHSVSTEGVEGTQQSLDGALAQRNSERNANGSARTLAGKDGLEHSNSKRDKTAENLCAEREDPSEFITHRAKDFLSSIKDIEHRFFRASESGKEVSRLLEANKISVGYSEAKGSSASVFLAAFHLVCCMGKTAIVSNEPPQHVTKVLTWNRSTSSRSTSSKNPLATASKDDNDDSGSDFIEEFCMIAGSHSSTLDRLYAWERKLYDEVKASESIRKVYDQKCHQLRNQFAKDLSTQVIDKTRAVVKDLHSRIRVAIHSVDSISKRIEKMRDEELQPQLVELIQGLIRMWKAMLECHHAQYITISLAYHARSSAGTPQGDARCQILAQLQHEIECFGLSFAYWINSHRLYVEALNNWLQNCILQPQKRAKSRRPLPFSPRQVLAPPIFVLCHDWSAGIKALPSDELNDAIKTFLSDLHRLMGQQAAEEMKKKEKPFDSNNEESENKDDEKNGDNSSNLSCIQTSLTKVLDRLTKYSEASLKMHEDIRQKCEQARIAYTNGRPSRF